KLHQVETLHAEPSQRPIDDGFYVAAVQCLQLGHIGYELRMHLDTPGERGVGATEGTNQCLDAGVDVGAVEGRDAGLDEPRHVFHRLLGIDCAVAAGQVPAALDEARHRVAVGEEIPGI